MTKTTLKALKGSIRKWEKIFLGGGEDAGSSNCPLCELFPYCYNSRSECPIFGDTHTVGCLGSPYEHWSGHHYDKHEGKYPYIVSYIVSCSECTELARAEFKYLEGLLPFSAFNVVLVI